MKEKMKEMKGAVRSPGAVGLRVRWPTGLVATTGSR